MINYVYIAPAGMGPFVRLGPKFPALQVLAIGDIASTNLGLSTLNKRKVKKTM